ncbi:hypothetical protein [Streptomyces sp. NPDC127066]|uniref:hypothetical protein n=1 Tax=Streptomyces sp. NPDC127066 TaxID=3347125 RepID=UPI00365E9690
MWSGSGDRAQERVEAAGVDAVTSSTNTYRQAITATASGCRATLDAERHLAAPGDEHALASVPAQRREDSTGTAGGGHAV